MKNIAFAIWMLGWWPAIYLVYYISAKTKRLNNKHTTHNSLEGTSINVETEGEDDGVESIILLIIWVVIGSLLYEY